MNALTPYLAKLHQQELLEQAELHRRAKLGQASQPCTPAWRRSVSGLLASVARSLDPSLEVRYASPLSRGRGVSRLRAC